MVNHGQTSSLRYVVDYTENGRPLVLDLSTDPAMVVMSPSTDVAAAELAAGLNKLDAWQKREQRP